MFTLKPNKINKKDPIGKGSFGEVYRYQKDENDKRWIVKIVQVTHKSLANAIQELVLGFRCNHPNVLPIKGFQLLPFGIDNAKSLKEWKDFNEWQLIMKIPLKKESLEMKIDRYWQNKELIPEVQIIKLFYEITCGLKYLHNKKMAHRDLKPDNILFDDEDVAVLSDIGLGYFTEGETSYPMDNKAGTLYYMAPEILLEHMIIKKKDLYKADIWSLGLLMLDVCLLPEKLADEDKRKILNWTGKRKEKEFRRMISNLTCSLFLKKILWDMIRITPSDRLTIEEVEDRLRKKIKQDLILNVRIKIEESQSIQTQVKEKMQVKESNEEFETQPKFFQSAESRFEVVDDKEAGMSSILNDLRKEHGKLFNFEANSSEQLLEIKPLLSNDTKSLTDDTLGNLMEGLCRELKDRNNRYLKTFALSLPHCDKVTGDAFSKFFKSTKVELNKLDISLQHSVIFTNDGLKNLGDQIANQLEYLQHLRLDLRGCKVLTDAGIENLILPTTLFCNQLQTLYIDFSNCEGLTGAGLRGLTIPETENIQQLRLSFSQCSKIENKGVTCLSKSILSSLKNLRYLDLRFAQCSGISNEGFLDLIQQICLNLPLLQHLQLDFSSSSITSEGLEQITTPITSNLKNIQHLHLDFQNCDPKIQQSEEVLKAAFDYIEDFVLKLGTY